MIDETRKADKQKQIVKDNIYYAKEFAMYPGDHGFG